MFTACPQAPPSASDPLLTFYPGARVLRRNLDARTRFDDRRYQHLCRVVDRVRARVHDRPLRTLADRYAVGRLVGGLLLGRRRANTDAVGLRRGMVTLMVR